jgi:hypothetical protein
MKWILALAIIVGLLWLGGDRVTELIDSGRQSAGGLTEPIYGLSKTIDETRARVDETNRKIGALTGHAAALEGMPSVDNSAAAYGAQARRDLQALNR